MTSLKMPPSFPAFVGPLAKLLSLVLTVTFLWSIAISSVQASHPSATKLRIFYIPPNTTILVFDPWTISESKSKSATAYGFRYSAAQIEAIDNIQLVKTGSTTFDGEFVPGTAIPGSECTVNNSITTAVKNEIIGLKLELPTHDNNAWFGFSCTWNVTENYEADFQIEVTLQPKVTVEDLAQSFIDDGLYRFFTADGFATAADNSVDLANERGFTHTSSVTIEPEDETSTSGGEAPTSEDDALTIEPENGTFLEFRHFKNSYNVGDRVTMELVETGNRDIRVDLWVAIQLPSGQWLFKTDLPLSPWIPWSLTLQPHKTSIASTNTNHYIFEFELFKGMGGYYTLYAVYVKEGQNPVTTRIYDRSNLVIREFFLAN